MGLKLSRWLSCLVPVFVLVAIPWLLFVYDPFQHLDLAGWRWMGVYLFPFGAFFYVTALRQMFAASEGELLTHGVYRFVRNPLEVGLFVMLLSECLMLESVAIFLWLGIVIAGGIVWVFYVKERLLVKKFRSAFLDYANFTPRFFPRFF